MSEENKDNSIFRLVNPEFEFEFMGKVYKLRKATLDKAVEYQAKIKQFNDAPGSDSKLVAFCVYIMLKDQVPELTEDIALQNIPADIDALEVLSILGFIKPSRLEQANKIRDLLINRSTGVGSLSSSLKEQDGAPTK
jgi:hypothetical protein